MLWASEAQRVLSVVEPSSMSGIGRGVQDATAAVCLAVLRLGFAHVVRVFELAAESAGDQAKWLSQGTAVISAVDGVASRVRSHLPRSFGGMGRA